MVVVAQVQAHVTTKYLIGYVILLVSLFGMIVVLSMSESSALTLTHVWYYDALWIFLTVSAWIPPIQSVYYRRIFATTELHQPEQSCYIEGNRFAGEWTIRKNYPRRMSSARAGSIVLTALFIILLIIDVPLLHSVWHSVVPRTGIESQVTAVQFLCLPIVFASSLPRYWTYWRYPNSLVLRRRGEWLTLQFRDTI